ncbi:MAG: YicC/YloC family endoribonuclease [Planctomycetaceae bacterium]
MLLSMTGFGNGSCQTETVAVSAEIKAVNNRYLKLSMRLPDSIARFESDIEKLIREGISRGSIQVGMRVRFLSGVTGYSIDADVLRSYVEQLTAVAHRIDIHGSAQPALADLLQLPGVVLESDQSTEAAQSAWPAVKQALTEALEHFQDFRQKEGESMKADLKLQCRTIEDQVTEVATHAPVVVSEYREKLLERVRKAVDDVQIPVEDRDVIRELALFADRCDINEEITRLRSHLQQFDRFLESDRSMGRKLEFLGQEMFREINTIGSKANNVTVAHSVVEMKAAIERIREVLQNVE